MKESILQIVHLKKYFPTNKGLVRAVDDVSFSIDYGETFGLVGESGSGKTTIGNLIMGFYAPDSGRILFEGQDIAIPISKRSNTLKKFLQIVFQDPGSSLNPKSTVKDILEAPLLIHESLSKLERLKRILGLLNYIGLNEDYLFKKPTELGGGEKQLVAIARAISTNPRFVVLD